MWDYSGHEVIIARVKPSLFSGVQGHAPPKILKIETVKYAFFNVLVNDSTHLLQEKIGQKYVQRFLRSEENDRRMN